MDTSAQYLKYTNQNLGITIKPLRVYGALLRLISQKFNHAPSVRPELSLRTFDHLQSLGRIGATF